MTNSSNNYILAHPFHLVPLSPWPITSSIMLLNIMLSMIQWLTWKSPLMLIMNLILMSLCAYLWWRDVVRESTLQGFHTLMVQTLHRYGMILFIASEIFFFFSFFWSFFHMSLSPSIEIGSMWPPKGIIPFNPFDIPLLNSIILISSGISITWCHHSILNNKFFESMLSLSITLILGFYFTFLQMFEYMEAKFSINDSVYGSTFFLLTGFHGLHVIIGSIFIMISLIRLSKNHFSKNHHFNFEAAAWYWHFVDVVWLFLFISVYWWSY